MEIRPNNEDKIKDLKKRKVVFARASELYHKHLNIYTTQYDKITKSQQKMIKV